MLSIYIEILTFGGGLMDIPQIINAGVYDAAVKYRNCTESKPQKVVVFEIELPLENGVSSYIDRRQYPITDDHIICAKPGQLRHTRLPFRCYFIHLMVGPVHYMMIYHWLQI